MSICFLLLDVVWTSSYNSLLCFFFFLFFFCRHYSQAIAGRICTKFGTNTSFCAGFIKFLKFFEKIKKPGHDERKTSKNR